MEVWLRVGNIRASVTDESSYNPEVVADWARLLGEMVDHQRMIEQALDERTVERYGGLETDDGG